MRLLLTGDLRYRLSWFKWLVTQAVNYDAVAIGDVLDVFNKEPLKRQIQQPTAWLAAALQKARNNPDGKMKAADTERFVTNRKATIEELRSILGD